MIKILLCCGGGFSSSAIVQRMTKDIKEQGLEEQIYMEFYPFSIAKDKYDHFDIIMCCPHLAMWIDRIVKESNPNIPVYVLPPKMYGLMDINEIYLDAKDIIEIYQQQKINPVHFPGEENILRITRSTAYRKQK